MAFATEAAAAIDAISQQFGPAAETAEEKIRQARRAIVRGQHAAEDASATATLYIRRRPLTTVAVAAGAGVLVGGMIGFAAGMCSRSEPAS